MRSHTRVMTWELCECGLGSFQITQSGVISCPGPRSQRPWRAVGWPAAASCRGGSSASLGFFRSCANSFSVEGCSRLKVALELQEPQPQKQHEQDRHRLSRKEQKQKTKNTSISLKTARKPSAVSRAGKKLKHIPTLIIIICIFIINLNPPGHAADLILHMYY